MKSKKGLIIGGMAGLGVLIIAAIVVLVILLKGGTARDAYRVIKVSKIDGSTYISRGDITDLEAYEGMVLQSGDTVSVDGNSTLILILDEDKVCYVEQNTELKIIAEGTVNASQTKIELVSGAFTLDVQNKLNDDSDFIVTTPNSTMAIRGTVVRTETGENNGKRYSRTSLFKGATDLSKVSNGSSVEDHDMKAGDEIIIGEDDEATQIKDVELSTLSQTTIENLINIHQEDPLEIFTEKQLQEEKENKEKDVYTVEFIYNNNVFATQDVKRGSTIVEPTLAPSSNGKWYVNLSSPVKTDLQIYWKE